MNKERTAALLTALEACTSDRLDELVRARAQVAALQEQNYRLEAQNRELERHSHELERHSHELERQHQELAASHQALEETCRVLEEKFARAPHTADGHAHPRSQGLAALLAHRARPDAPSQPSRPAPAEKGAHDAAMTPAKAPEAAHASAPPAVQPGGQAPLPAGEAPSPQGLLNEWYRRYPDAFFKGHTRPLKVGIHEDLLAREPWPEKLVRRALACYVHLPRYLKAVREHGERVGLDGEAAGPVSEGEARYARKKLDELRAQQQAERKAATPDPEGGKGAKQGGHNSGRQAADRKIARDPRRSSAAGPESGAVLEETSTSAPASMAASPEATTPAEAPGERLERKLGALLAKHSQH